MLDFVGHDDVLRCEERITQAGLLGDKTQHIGTDAGVSGTLRVVARHGRGVDGMDAQRRQVAQQGALLLAQWHWRTQPNALGTVARRQRRGGMGNQCERR